MMDYYYIIISGIVLYVVEKKIGLKNIYNPVIIYVLFHVFFLFLPLSMRSLFENKGYFISNETIIFINIGFFLTIATVFLLQQKFNKKTTFILNIDKIKIISPTKKDISIAYFFLTIGILLAFIFYYEVNGIPILQNNVEVFRIEARKGSGMITLFSISFIAFSSLIIIGYSKILFNVKNSFIFLLSSFFLVSFGNRGPFIIYLIIFLYVQYFKVYKRQLKTLQAFIIVLVFWSFVVFLEAFRKFNSLENILEIVTARFFWRPYVNVIIFDEIIHFFKTPINGLGYLIDLETLLPGYTPNFGTWVKMQLGMTFEGGSVTMSYLGYSYINFGLVGMLLAPVLNIIFLYLLNSFFIKKNNISFNRFIFLFYFSISVGGAIGSGFLPVLLNFLPFIITFLLFDFLKYFSK